MVSFFQVSHPKLRTEFSSLYKFYLHRPSYSSWFDQRNILWGVQITELIITHFSPVSHYILPSRSKHLPQHSTLEYFLSMCYHKYERSYKKPVQYRCSTPNPRKSGQIILHGKALKRAVYWASHFATFIQQYKNGRNTDISVCADDNKISDGSGSIYRIHVLCSK